MLWKKESLESDAPFVDICAKYAGNSIFRKFSLLDSSDIDSKKSMEKSSSLSDHYRLKGMHQSVASNWFDAIELYNQALCFAENESIDMGCAYADRSVCFFNLKMYENCMVDIKLAKSNNCPAMFLSKLNKRYESCKKMLQTPIDDSDGSIFKSELSYEANESCPSLAKVLQIETNEVFSRHVTANSDIDVGQTIMIEQGFVWSTSETYKRCCICLRSDTNLVPCAKCTNSLVCYGTCEKGDLHEIECSMDLNASSSNGSNLTGASDNTIVRSILTALRIVPNVNELMRFVDRIVSNGKSDVTTSISTPLSEYSVFLENGLKEMRHFPKKEEKSLYKTIARIYDAITEEDDFERLFDEDSHHQFLMHLIGHHMCSLRHSARGVVVGENDGTTIYPIVGSLFRHSCNPNAVLVTSGRSTVAVTIQPIKMGDEITISYIPEELDRSKKNRQKVLVKRYNVECKCKRCMNPSTIGNNNSNGSVSSQFRNDIRKQANFEPVNIPKRNKLMKQCEKYLSASDPDDWCDDKCLVLMAYSRFLRTKYYQNM